jgi:hypothetical protein
MFFWGFFGSNLTLTIASSALFVNNSFGTNLTLTVAKSVVASIIWCKTVPVTVASSALCEHDLVKTWQFLILLFKGLFVPKLTVLDFGPVISIWPNHDCCRRSSNESFVSACPASCASDRRRRHCRPEQTPTSHSPTRSWPGTSWSSLTLYMFCPIQRLLLSMLCPFATIYHLIFFTLRCFFSRPFLPFDVLSVDVSYRRLFFYFDVLSVNPVHIYIDAPVCIYTSV